MVTPLVLAFPEFLLVSAQRPFEDGRVRIFTPKDVLGPQFSRAADFHQVRSLANNTAKTSAGKDLVKIRPAVAQRSRQKIKKKKKTKTQNAS